MDRFIRGTFGKKTIVILGWDERDVANHLRWKIPLRAFQTQSDCILVTNGYVSDDKAVNTWLRDYCSQIEFTITEDLRQPFHGWEEFHWGRAVVGWDGEAEEALLSPLGWVIDETIMDQEQFLFPTSYGGDGIQLKDMKGGWHNG